MSQRFACRMDTVRSIYQAAKFLSKRVKRFLLNNGVTCLFVRACIFDSAWQTELYAGT
jgi:hypothetical protein